jgi:2-keto-4-pentenoate hydratase/2-oxohepta-3-ene-1,7-dioic acid hydratase in catechol pathway
MKAPANPVSFIKSPATIASWGEDIPIPKLAQDEQLDYEGELVHLNGPKDCHDH